MPAVQSAIRQTKGSYDADIRGRTGMAVPRGRGGVRIRGHPIQHAPTAPPSTFSNRLARSRRTIRTPPPPPIGAVSLRPELPLLTPETANPSSFLEAYDHPTSLTGAFPCVGRCDAIGGVARRHPPDGGTAKPPIGFRSCVEYTTLAHTAFLCRPTARYRELTPQGATASPETSTLPEIPSGEMLTKPTTSALSARTV